VITILITILITIPVELTWPSIKYPVNLKRKLFSQVVNSVEEFKLGTVSNVQLKLQSAVLNRHSARTSTWMDKRCPFVCACRRCAVRRYVVLRGWKDNRLPARKIVMTFYTTQKRENQ
jgi:hypothetical protein